MTERTVHTGEMLRVGGANSGHGFDPIVEHDEGDAVLAIEIVDSLPDCFLCERDLVTRHRTGTIEHDAEGQRLPVLLLNGIRSETKGEMNRAGLIGQDGLIIEEEFCFHQLQD